VGSKPLFDDIHEFAATCGAVVGLGALPVWRGKEVIRCLAYLIQVKELTESCIGDSSFAQEFGEIRRERRLFPQVPTPVRQTLRPSFLDVEQFREEAEHRRYVQILTVAHPG